MKFRMYGWTPYNISPIQCGIQFGHAVVEYQLKYGRKREYLDWAKNDKTFIILNGGITTQKVCSGMLDIVERLKLYKIKHAIFHEPDLNDALTGICLIVDERVYDRIKYPTLIIEGQDIEKIKPEDRVKNFSKKGLSEYKKFLKNIGGQQNEFLRYYLPKFKLAS